MTETILEGYNRLLIEIGLGVDLIGNDDDEAVRRAINDIVHRVCIPFFEERKIPFKEAILVIDIYTPNPDNVREKLVIEALPVKPKNIIIRKHLGGARIPGLYNHIIASIVAITIYVPKRA